MIAFPSFKLLYLMDEVIDAQLTIKAIGHQWFLMPQTLLSFYYSIICEKFFSCASRAFKFIIKQLYIN